MTQRDEQLHIPLNTGFADRVIDEALPPLMRVSENTRFTKDRGIVRKAPAKRSLLADIPLHYVGYSLVPAGRGSVIGYSCPGNPQLVLDETYADGGAPGRLASPLNGIIDAGGGDWKYSRQNAYHPVQVKTAFTTAAGQFEADSGSTLNSATIVNGNRLWVVWVGSWDDRGSDYATPAAPVDHAVLATLTYGLFCAVYDAQTGAVVSPACVLLAGLTRNDASWIGFNLRLTLHDDTGKVRIWYQNFADTTIRTRLLTLFADQKRVEIGAELTTVTPLGTAADLRWEVASGAVRRRGEAGFAWLITRHSATATSLAVHRINLATGAAAITQAIALATSNAADPISVAIDEVTLSTPSAGDLSYVAVAYSSVTGLANTPKAQAWMWNGSALAGVLPATTAQPTTFQQFALGITLAHFMPFQGSMVPALYVVANQTPGGAPTLGTNEFAAVMSTFSLVGGGALVRETVLDWYEPVGRPTSYSLALPAATYGSEVEASATYVHVPLFSFTRHFGPTGDPEELLDPALQIFTPTVVDDSSNIVMTPVARLGVFRLAPVAATGRQWLTAYDDVVGASYPADNTSTYYSGRFELHAAILDLARRACASCQDDVGGALIAGAQPAYFDGQETTELGPLFQPCLELATFAGASSFASVNYRVTAIYTWIDSNGQRHRSAFAAPQTIALTNLLTLQVSVMFPAGSMKNGVSQRAARVALYMCEDSELVHRIIADVPANNVIGCAIFYITAPPPTSAAAMPFDGGELVPVCPGALHDIAIVGSRAVGISAERRNTAIYSKTKIADIAFEFPAEFEFVFPSSAGRLQKSIDLDGNWVVLAERGVYVVPGVGPDNAGGGVAFSDPRKISDVGCVSRDSVVHTSAGVVYQTRGGYALLAPGGAVQKLTQADPAEQTDPVAAVALEPTQEALVFARDERAELALNFEVGAFSEWTHFPATALESGTGPAVWHAARAGDLVFVSHDERGFSIIDPTSGPSAAAGVLTRVTTGWIQPAGPQGACVLRELLIQGSLDGDTAHGLAVTVTTDYASDAHHTTTETFTGAAIEAAADPNGRYTLRVVLHGMNARAVKIDLAEEAYSPGVIGAFQPLSATLGYSPSSTIQRKFAPGATR